MLRVEHFSEPARSTMRSFDLILWDLFFLDTFSRNISKIAWDRELLLFIWEDFVALVLMPIS